jgi:hypothetical protein
MFMSTVCSLFLFLQLPLAWIEKHDPLVMSLLKSKNENRCITALYPGRSLPHAPAETAGIMNAAVQV